MSIRINVGADFDAKDLRRARRELDALERSAETLRGKMLRLGDRMQNVGRTMSRAGQTMARRVTAPLVAVGAASVKTAADFETSFAKIQGLVGVAAEDIGQLERAALELGPTYGKSANEAAEALFFITSAGLRGKEAIDTLEASLKASAVGLGETATVADLVTSSVNAYGSAVLSASSATDVLTNAVRLGKLEPQELAGSIGQVLPLASAMGVEFDQVGAAFAAMSRTGTDAATAGTQLRQILATLLKPTAEANTELENYGLSAEGLRKQLRERGLLSVLETLTSTLSGNDEAVSRVFGNIRALSGVLDLMGSNVEGTRQIFDGMANSTGVLNDAFSVTADTSAFQFQQALANLKTAGIELGQELMPVVMRIVDGFESLVKKFTDLSPAQQDMIIKFGAFVAIVGPLGIALGGLIGTIGAVTAALGAMSGAMIIATGGLVLVGAAIAGIAWSNAADDVTGLAKAQELEAMAAEHAAAGNNALAESYRDQAAAIRARQAQSDNEAQRFQQQAQGARETRAENEAAAAAAEALEAANADLADAVDGTGDAMGAAGPRVVRLTAAMRDQLRQINEQNVGVSKARDLIAQFSRELLAAGQITDQTASAAQALAQAVRQEIDAALQEGNRRLDEARRKFEEYRDAIAGGIRSGNTLSDAVSRQTDALEAVTRAEEDYQRAVESGDETRIQDAADALDEAQRNEKSFLDFLQTGVDSAEGFAAQIDALREAGASMDVVRQIAELGARTGSRVAAELMAGGEAAIQQANGMVQAVEAASRRAGQGAAQQFFGAGVEAARQFVRAVEATIPELQSVLDRIADMIERAIGTRPNVSLTGEQTFITPPSGGQGPTGGGGDGAPTPTPPRPADPGRITLPGMPTFFAEGGLVTGPTLGVVGEAGPELIIPLDEVDGFGGQTTINVTVTSADPQAVVEALRRYTRQNGALSQVVTV
jgi:TP901 family phage tail tape measure protein